MFLIIAVTGSSPGFSQDPDPYGILDEVAIRLDSIVDYKVNVLVEVDVDFINMPDKHAVMFYKKPSKVKIKSDEFLLLPKQGFDYSIRELLMQEYSAVFAGRESISGLDHFLIKVIPLNKRTDLVLSNIWISAEGLRVSKMENFTKNKGNYTIELEYASGIRDLPSKMTISFEIEDFKFPVRFMGKSIEVDREKLKEEGPKTGSVIFHFSGYELNTGIKDEQFDDN